MAERYSYRNLILWQRAQELAFHIIQIAKRLPNTPANAIIIRQVIASATSVAANIAEGHGRFSPGAHRNHLSIARGSATETDSWLDLLYREGLLSRDEEQKLHQQCNEVVAMLTAKINSLRDGGQDGSRAVREEQWEYAVDQAEPLHPFDPNDYVS
jgi:four helix bundle protein